LNSPISFSVNEAACAAYDFLGIAGSVCVKWAKSVRGSGAASMTANLNKLDLRVSIVEYGFLS
jgi:hypothetical protein